MGSLTRRSFLLGAGGAVALAACGGDCSGGSAGHPASLGVSAIPDQNPELLNWLYPWSRPGSGRPPG